MKLKVKKIRLNELGNFVESKTFQEFKVIPITRQRAISFLNNPAALPTDVVLYLGFIDNVLVAFRSVFAAKIKSNPNRFGWCSGNWVHPGFRRNGFSETLLIEAFSDWDKKLMFTNYAPNSEQLYLKTGKFYPIHQFNGFRGYLFPKTKKLVPLAKNNVFTKLLFELTDSITTFISSFRVWFFNFNINPEIRFEAHQFPDAQCYQSIQENNEDLLFVRGKNELEWIFKFPWIVKEDLPENKKYPFSSHSKSFEYHTIKIIRQERFLGFFIFSVREGNLKTLYFDVPSGFEFEIAQYLKKFCAKHKIEVATVYKTEIAQQLFKRKLPFLHAKKYGQKIYSSFEPGKKGNHRFQDGEGDVIFT